MEAYEGPPPSTDYGTYAYLTQTLEHLTKSTTISCRRDRTFHPRTFWTLIHFYKIVYIHKDANTGMGYFYTQIPVSREVLPADV
ncbi:MAG: hypothetical protein CM15mP23_00040 [Cryomorphaceae bacterium]|nr:MAG: hypothetical protein CM15mP23_00040 [Cryomorphaceae bacterium]